MDFDMEDQAANSTEQDQASEEAYEIYAAATLLSPLCRRAYFDRCWEQDWTAAMIPVVEEYFCKNYKDQQTINKVIKLADPSPLQTRLRIALVTTESDNSFHTYINEQPLQYSVDLINWWATAIGYPELQQMALDIISIPAMSAEVERIFSSAKKVLTPERNSLKPDNLEIYEVLHNWWNNNIILQTHDDTDDDDDDDD